MYLTAASTKTCFGCPSLVSKLCHEVTDFNINKEDVEQLKQTGKRGDFSPTRGCLSSCQTELMAVSGWADGGGSKASQGAGSSHYLC